MVPTIKRLTLSLGFAVGLGFALVPQGCGGVHPVADIPEHVAAPIKGCVVEHTHHVRDADQIVKYDVTLDSNGQVDSIALMDSSVGDEELEQCIAASIRSLTQYDLLRHRSENFDRELAQPESRMLLGTPAVPLAVCVASPPCFLALTILMGASAITVQIMVHAATAKPTTTAQPTTTTTTSPPVAVPRRCLPCLPVPVGGFGYRYDSVEEGKKEHNGMADHTHHFRMQQSPPANGCRCFWDKKFMHPTAGFSPLPGAVLVVSTPGGGGIAP